MDVSPDESKICHVEYFVVTVSNVCCYSTSVLYFKEIMKKGRMNMDRSQGASLENTSRFFVITWKYVMYQYCNF